MFKRFSRYAGAAIVLLAILFVFRRYYGGDGLLYGDSNLQWDRSLLDAALGQLGHSWTPAFGGGRPAVIINATTAAMSWLQELVSFAGIPLSTVLVYPLVLGVAYAGSWVAARRLAGSSFGAHVAAAFFVGNPWIWDRVLLGHILILAGAAVTPWMLATLLYRQRLGGAFAPLLFAEAALMLQCDPRVSYMMFAGLVVIGVVWIAQSLSARERERTWQGAALVLTPFAALLLNAWWTLPFLLIPGINPVRRGFPPLEDVLSYSRYADFAHNLVFSGSFLHFSWDRAALHGVLAFGLWYAAMVAVLLSALFARTPFRLAGLILRIGLVFSLLLSLGTALVQPQTMMWIYAHIPMSSFFRDPNKLGFIAIFCMLPLLAARLGTLSTVARGALALAVAIAILPAFSGELRTADGTGLQPFHEREDFVSVLHYLQARPTFPNFRIAMLPPWTAEVALSPDEHPVAEPFVFQYSVPLMDTKLINTASDMNMSAWRVFEDFYSGTDLHPGASLARLGIRYVIADEGATLSAGAANTPFYNVPASVVHRALLDAAFHEVFRSGPLRVYENPAFEPLLRTVVQPAVLGGIPEHLRAALPAASIGDSIEAVDDHAAWPFPVLGAGANVQDACRSALPRASVQMAYDRAGAHADWQAYWVDSDYLQQGTGDPARARLLSYVPLPYAFTASRAQIDFRIDVRPGAAIAVQGAVLSKAGVPEYSIDGAPWKPLTLPAFVPQWVTLAAVAPGRHALAVRGSAVGTVLRAVTGAALPTCPRVAVTSHQLPATASGVQNWLVPSPYESVEIVPAGGKFVFTSQNAVAGGAVGAPLRTSGVIEGPGADAVTIDRQGIAPGVPTPFLTGYHGVQFFARGAPVATSAWSHVLASAPTGEHGTPRFAFSPRYTGDAAQTVLSGLVPGQTVVVRTPFQGPPQGAEVRIMQGGAVVNRYPLAAAQSDIALSVYNDTLTILAQEKIPGRGRITLLPVQAFSGVLLGEGVMNVPARAVAVPHGARIAESTRTLGTLPLKLGEDGLTLLGAVSSESYTPSRGSQIEIRYAGFSTTPEARCTLHVTFETSQGPQERAVADLQGARVPFGGAITFNVLPRTAAVLPAFRCEPSNAVLTLRSATMSFLDAPAGAILESIAVPKAARRAIQAVAHRDVSAELTQLAGHPADVVSLSSYDANWELGGSSHFIANGMENGWAGTSGGNIAYAPQVAYRRDLAVAALAWALTIGWIVAALLACRRQDGASDPMGR